MHRLRMAGRLAAARRKKEDKTAATNIGPKSSRGNIDIYNIRIQQDFDKKALLPPVSVWTRVVDRASFLTATLRVTIKRRGLFFDRQLASGFYTCILSRQGHLVIYTEHSTNEGYAVNLLRASRIIYKYVNYTAATSGSTSAQDSKRQLFNQSPKRVCKVTGHWRFGTIALNLPDRRIADWCCAIFGATSCESTPPLLSDRRIADWCCAIFGATSCESTPPLLSLKDVRSTTNTEDATLANQILRADADEAEDVNERENAEEESMATVASASELSNAPSVEDWKSLPAGEEEATLPEPKDVDEESSSSSQQEEQQADEPAMPCTTEPTETSGEEEAQKEEEDDDDEDNNLGHEEDEADANTEEEEEEAPSANGHVGNAPPPSPLKRRVTFSDLRAIFEVPEAEEEEEHEEASPGNNNAEEEERIACCCPLPPMFELALESDEEERKKEQHVMSAAIDQMRIVGQSSSSNGTTGDGEQQEQEEANTTAGTTTATQFRPTSERFDWAWHIFESGRANQKQQQHREAEHKE